MKVWETFIDQTKAQMKARDDVIFRVDKNRIIEFAEKHFDDHPQARWNGRQIRNAFHTALAMAEYDARHEETGDSDDADESKKGDEKLVIKLGRDQFEDIALTVKSFDQYIKQTLGMTYEHQASVESLRHDVDALKKETKGLAARQLGTTRSRTPVPSRTSDGPVAESSRRTRDD